MCEEDYIWNPYICTYEIGIKHWKKIIGDSVVTCGEIIDVVAKLYDEPTNFIEKTQPVK